MWEKRSPSARELKRLKLQEQIAKLYEASHQIYGAPKIAKEINRDGTTAAERTVTRYMHDMGLHAWYRRPYTVTTRSRDFSEQLKNILNRDFSPSQPNRSM